jgi:hypothetical protein
MDPWPPNGNKAIGAADASDTGTSNAVTATVQVTVKPTIGRTSPPS